MKPSSIMSSMLAIAIVITSPTLAFAHAGHGDEFQAEGGVERVQVNSETDSIFGIQVAPIEKAAPSGSGVLIPVSALVDSDGKQLVFVQYENFYEPVPVSTGATQGNLIEVTDGLSLGEQLVTQGSLSLYAESRKTQTAESSPESPTVTADSSLTKDTTHQKADAEGIPHSHDAEGNLVTGNDTEQTESSSFPVGLAIALGSAVALGIGAFALFKPGSKSSSSVQNSVKKSKGA